MSTSFATSSAFPFPGSPGPICAHLLCFHLAQTSLPQTCPLAHAVLSGWPRPLQAPPTEPELPTSLSADKPLEARPQL